jgi:hypothetical protein
MRRRFRFLAAVVVAALAAAGCAAYLADSTPAARVAVDLASFHDALAPYGDWLWVEPWGRVWTPWDVGPGWRPYTHGRWVYTVHGWTWASYWPWGWAPFHYGRWTFHPRHGWLWVPGTVWGPAWVAWRHGTGWIGWAPLPPGARWEVGFGLRWEHPALESHWWSFVAERDLVDSRLDRRLLPPARNATLIGATREVTRYEELERQVVERGVAVEAVERARGAAVPRVAIEDSTRPQAGRAAVTRERVRVYRPVVEAPPEAAGRAPEAPPPEEEGRPPAARLEDRPLRELEEWGEQEQRELAAIHARERRSPPAEVTPQELEARQDAERRAQRDEVSRERRVLADRQAREQDRRQRASRSRPPTKPAAKEKPG